MARTSLEKYLAVTIQMLMARSDGKDDNSYLDKLDELHKLLTVEDIEFISEMGKDWGTHYWCMSCAAVHLNSYKCSRILSCPTELAACEGCGKPSSTILCQACFDTGDFQ